MSPQPATHRNWAAAPRTERRPCRLCGWGPGRGIHSQILSGPRKGQPWGHAYTIEQPKEPGNG